MKLMSFVMLFGGTLAVAACAKSEEEAPVVVGALEATSCNGQNVTECGFGRKCNEARTCVPADCHAGSEELGIAPRTCAAGASCAFEDGAALNNGVGSCEPKTCSGFDITECGFGARCSDAKTCVPAECHDGNRFLEIEPLVCALGASCAFEDGASAGNGVGFCTSR